MNTIKSAWESFASEVLPKDCSAIQREETEKAFYSGCGAMFGLMTGPLADMNEEACLHAMDGLHTEILSFAGSL